MGGKQDATDIVNNTQEVVLMATVLTGSDGEMCSPPPGRALRLSAVLYAVHRGPFGPGVVEKIGVLNDHKGTLEVTWRQMPTFGEMLSVSRAWEDVGLESMTTHSTADGRLVANSDGVTWDIVPSSTFDLLAAEVPEMNINPFRVQ